MQKAQIEYLKPECMTYISGQSEAGSNERFEQKLSENSRVKTSMPKWRIFNGEVGSNVTMNFNAKSMNFNCRFVEFENEFELIEVKRNGEVVYDFFLEAQKKKQSHRLRPKNSSVNYWRQNAIK